MNEVNRIKHENAQERAIYNSPDNVFNWSWPKVPRHKFLNEKKEAYDFDKSSLLIPLDISDILSTPYPATIPSILARYIRLKKGDDLTQYHKDIAASAQLMYEVSLFHMLNKVHDNSGLDSLCLAGGCCNNSVANGKIRSHTKFKNVYIAASSGDAGGAVGAAYYCYHETNNRNIAKTLMDHAYLGPSFNNKDISELIVLNSKKLNKVKFKIVKTKTLDDLTKRTSAAIREGKVIGWFQGRMEWGPRALGNRSILGDPTRADMKEILNIKIKRRESFRPFAPSVLRECVSDWFEEDDEVPFMMKVFKVKTQKQTEIKAVTHVDGSGRLQTVNKKTNPRYHALISEFYSLTGVPMLLNTSFTENEPVVCTPMEALNCFLRTKMDFLVLEDWIIQRRV